MIGLELAPLSAEERAHEARLLAAIGAAIDAAGGSIPFARFMELALYAPGLGYYAAGAHKLGAGGDFVTAPELSPVFARCLATQCAEVLATLGGGALVELGAGSGVLAAELMTELARLGTLPDSYRILEPSPDLRARQVERVAALPPALRARIAWLERPPEAPFRGVLLANEVLDALPVERFRIGAGGVESLNVARAGERLATRPVPAGAELAAAVRELEDSLGVALAPGYTSELCLTLAPWLEAVSAPLAAGVALFIDYGAGHRDVYAPERAAGTLSCYHRQRRHDDPFRHVGLQDLTAWVDFTRVAEAAVALGLDVAGYTTQAHFLLALGFEAQVEAVRREADPGRAPLVGRRASKLVLPGEMGETFKCIGLARDYAAPLAGFALRDFTALL